MKDEERAHRDAYFQEEFESLKISVAHITSVLEHTLRNNYGEGPSNRPVNFNQTSTIAQPEERMSEHGQRPPPSICAVNDTCTSPGSHRCICQ